MGSQGLRALHGVADFRTATKFRHFSRSFNFFGFDELMQKGHSKAKIVLNLFI